MARTCTRCKKDFDRSGVVLYGSHMHCNKCRAQLAELGEKYFDHQAVITSGIPQSMVLVRDSDISERARDIVLETIHGTLSLFLYGPPQSGKTLCASIFAYELIKRRAHIRMVSCATLAQRLRNKQINSVETMMLHTTPHIILDDLGVQQDAPWLNEWFFDLVNDRYNHCYHTSATCNDPESLEPRLARRLMENAKVVEFTELE